MTREHMDLTPICQRYKARVIRIIPQEDYYLVETNRGPKELRVWPRVDVMRWSYAWREQMARQGFRNVERFIRTRDAKPYVVSGKKGYTMTDHLRKVGPYTPGMEHAHYAGQMIAKMHQAQSSQSFPVASDLLKREQSLAVEEAKRARHVFEHISETPLKGEQRHFIASMFPPLLERMERSAELISTTLIPEEYLAVSHREMGRENWGLVEDQLFLRGFYRPTLSIQHRDTATLLRQIYMDTQNLSSVDAFLDGYEENKPLSYDEYRLLLAFMAYPQEVWRQIENIVHPITLTGEAQDESALVQVEQAIRRQQLIDELLQHIAQRAERGRRLS
ncbi:hypothetical protein [Brevibacillus dissolubilis]|uniref:hypothetical protein n=1 Tax=Brevibacillus dissolubilis TaxID=1844116 RepID=UPI001115BC9A|nr:hypothetical protein [Brevibacillus dissolubilis]